MPKEKELRIHYVNENGKPGFKVVRELCLLTVLERIAKRGGMILKVEAPT